MWHQLPKNNVAISFYFPVILSKFFLIFVEFFILFLVQIEKSIARKGENITTMGNQRHVGEIKI